MHHTTRRSLLTFTAFAALALAPACQSGSGFVRPEPRPLPMDIHSHARPNEVRVRHVSLDLDLDFVAGVARGGVTLELYRLEPTAPLVLDVQGLEISAVRGTDGKRRDHVIGKEHDNLGAALTIELEPADSSVRIDYATRPGAEALQWLAPEQTAGGRHPFLFSQGQAVLTRTWIPLQDSPGVRVSYDARITAPEALTVVMSAESKGRDADGAFRFELERPIPPYLIAIGCGELVSEKISKRCAVWAEPELAQRAAWEFADTEKMIQSAEELFGPYRWGRYDLLVLPPAFPYGGMENPLLTFATPTVIAGDRSLVALVAHELAHSWSGNLVTNATWGDFWLNEGFTVYFEKRIMEVVFGEARANMERVLDFADLEEEVARLEEWQTVLAIDLTGRHPDDGFSGVPYEKGALFLRRLEQLVGRRRFDAFLRGWFDGHEFESVRTEDFVAYLREGLPDALKGLDLERWIHAPGIPADAPVPESGALAQVEAELARWRGGAAPESLATDAWVTQQWLHFLQSMPPEVDGFDMALLDEAFGFTKTGNAEILCAWLELSIERDYPGAELRTASFLNEVGRRKFLRPLYAALVKTEAGTQRARTIYAQARPKYHAVSRQTLDAIVLPAD